VRALVTGGAGFIGSHLVDALLLADIDVVVLDDLSSGRRERLNDAVTFVEGAVECLDDVRRAVDGCEVVYHLAAHRSVFRSVESPLATDSANTHGTLTVLVAARDAGVRRVVNSSSSSVYGGGDVLPTPESASTVPKSPYAVSKLAAEHHCRVFSELFDLETVSLRYFNVFGPRQDPNGRYAAVIPLFISALLNDKPPEVHGDGRQTRDFTYVTDAVAANMRAATAPTESAQGQAYNVAGGEPWDLLRLLGHLAELTGRTPNPIFAPARAGDVRHTWADTSSAEARLGHRPSVSMADGLAAALAQYRQDMEGSIAPVL
jgi:nucleoside-diphosphate-sugar epimerase